MKIRKHYKLPAAVSSVYSAWISSDTVIAPATSMDIKAEIGGHYRLFMQGPDFSASNEGFFSLVEPNRQLVYSWEWNKDGEVTQIDVRFNRDGDGNGDGTIVDIRHSGFNNSDSQKNHDMGWDSYIEGFTALLNSSA